MTNLNDFAKDVALKEGKNLSLSIGQVKEVMKIIFTKLNSLPLKEVLGILNKYR